MSIKQSAVVQLSKQKTDNIPDEELGTRSSSLTHQSSETIPIIIDGKNVSPKDLLCEIFTANEANLSMGRSDRDGSLSIPYVPDILISKAKQNIIPLSSKYASLNIVFQKENTIIDKPQSTNKLNINIKKEEDNTTPDLPSNLASIMGTRLKSSNVFNNDLIENKELIDIPFENQIITSTSSGNKVGVLCQTTNSHDNENTTLLNSSTQTLDPPTIIEKSAGLNEDEEISDTKKPRHIQLKIDCYDHFKKYVTDNGVNLFINIDEPPMLSYEISHDKLNYSQNTFFNKLESAELSKSSHLTSHDTWNKGTNFHRFLKDKESFLNNANTMSYLLHQNLHGVQQLNFNTPNLYIQNEGLKLDKVFTFELNNYVLKKCEYFSTTSFICAYSAEVYESVNTQFNQSKASSFDRGSIDQRPPGLLAVWSILQRDSPISMVETVSGISSMDIYLEKYVALGLESGHITVYNFSNVFNPTSIFSSDIQQVMQNDINATNFINRPMSDISYSRITEDIINEEKKCAADLNHLTSFNDYDNPPHSNIVTKIQFIREARITMGKTTHTESNNSWKLTDEMISNGDVLFNSIQSEGKNDNSKVLSNICECICIISTSLNGELVLWPFINEYGLINISKESSNTLVSILKSPETGFIPSKTTMTHSVASAIGPGEDFSLYSFLPDLNYSGEQTTTTSSSRASTAESGGTDSRSNTSRGGRLTTASSENSSNGQQQSQQQQHTRLVCPPSTQFIQYETVTDSTFIYPTKLPNWKSGDLAFYNEYCGLSPVIIISTFNGMLHTYQLIESEFIKINSIYAHKGPILELTPHPLLTNVFMSVSFDLKMKLWKVNENNNIELLLSLARQETVTDFSCIRSIAWCGVSSTVFAGAGSDGRVEIWDLSVSVLDPICVIPGKSCELKDQEGTTGSTCNISISFSGDSLIFGTCHGQFTVYKVTNLYENLLPDNENSQRFWSAVYQENQ